MLPRHTDIVTFKGLPLTLLGKPVQVGDKAPDFTVRKGLTPDSVYTLATDAGKTRIFNVVPSLDTHVCDAQTRRFNAEAANLGETICIVTISMDLPPAQERWCAAAGIDRVIVASDYYDRSFGKAYGLLIEELGILARAVMIIDPAQIVRYVQIVPELTEEPIYEPVLVAVREVAGQ
ncbi:MAG: thiol peroxidase [Candidatus Zipacnadales bacterium]